MRTINTDIPKGVITVDQHSWRWMALLWTLGCLAFAVGALVYAVDRDAAHGLRAASAFQNRAVFGVLGQWLPSFAHVLAFSLFTAAVLPRHSQPAYGACIAWCVLNLTFEVGQHSALRAPLAEMLESNLGHGLPIRYFGNYFLRGTFDAGDLAATVLGALTAAAMMRLIHPISGGIQWIKK